MYILAILCATSVASALSIKDIPRFLFANPERNHPNAETYRIPTVHESAVQARRILSLESIGTLSTVFPSSSSVVATENRPGDVAGTPIGLMDYFADCDPSSSGDPTILAINIATSFKNVRAGSNITLSLRWHPPTSKRYSAAAMPRFSLVGELQPIDENIVKEGKVAACFLSYHPDAAWWLPGNVIHESHWVRLVVKEVYWIGGFGDRAYIGWIPVEDWRNVTKKEIDDCVLPGEHRSNSWFSGLGSWLTEL